MENKFKDIILPIAQIVSTLLVGGGLAFYLNRRSNRDKIKGLLIDSYMDYLVIYKNFYLAELNSFSISVYKKLLAERKSSLNISIEMEIEKIIKQKKAEYDKKWIDENASISLSTYKFAFLLGSKKYLEKLQELETNWLKHIESFDSRQELIKIITKSIIDDDSIKALSISANTTDFMIKTETTIEQILNNKLFNDFRTYNDALAIEILKY